MPWFYSFPSFWGLRIENLLVQSSSVMFQSFPRSLFLLASLQECCLAKILCFLCSIDFLAVGTMVLMTLGSVWPWLMQEHSRVCLLLSFAPSVTSSLWNEFFYFKYLPSDLVFLPALNHLSLFFTPKFLTMEFLYGLLLLSHFPFICRAFPCILAKKSNIPLASGILHFPGFSSFLVDSSHVLHLSPIL